MPQSILLQVGQCGNQVGSRFWTSALEEHAQYNTTGVFDDSMATLFRNVDHRFQPLCFHESVKLTHKMHLKGIHASTPQPNLEFESSRHNDRHGTRCCRWRAKDAISRAFRASPTHIQRFWLRKQLGRWLLALWPNVWRRDHGIGAEGGGIL
eukprot:Partr_v1_DN27091_c3_g1_i3_m28787